MKKNERDSTFRFGITEEKGKDITFAITEEDYQKQLAAGIPKDELLSVGLHKARRGGFRERHPNFSLEDVEIRITNENFQQNTAPSAKKGKDKKAA